MKIAIYPGSFDPITLGHLDIIRRGAACFDKLYVCVMVNCEKKLPMFTPERRLELIRRSVADIPNVEVENWSGLLADYAREKGARILLKGVRNATDWDMELQMSRINQGILPGAGDAAAARQRGVRAFQLHHGPRDDPLRPAAGEVCTGAHRRGTGKARG